MLQQVALTIAASEPFTPATSTRTFRLAAPDFIAPVLPTLLHDVQSTAPGVRVELAPYSPAAVRELVDGRYDALIAPDGIRNEDLRGQPLGTWPWVVYGRKGHPAFADWTLEAWSDYPQLRVHTSGVPGQSPIDRRASQLDIRRVVGAIVPNFSVAAQILAQTNLLLTVPSVAMANTAAAFRLDRREMPFDLPDMGFSLFRSAADGNEPGIRWFLERVAAAFSGLDHSQ